MNPVEGEVCVPEVVSEEQAQELRAALDEQLERVRSLSLEEQFSDAWTVEEQLAQFVGLVSGYSEDALKRAVLMTHPANDDLRLPIHLACDTNAPTEIIQWLLENDEQKESIQRKDKWGDLPLHTACSRKDIEVVRLLLEHDTTKNTVFTKDNYSALPLHMACRYCAPPEVIKMLLEADENKTTLFEPGMYDQLAIHIACRCDLEPDSIQLLLDYDLEKKTVLIEDNAGRLPIHVAYLRNSHNRVIQILLEAMICGRIERIGLDMWKRDMRQYLKSMDTHERDFNTADKLEMTRVAFRNFMDRAWVLELAVWKAKCLVSGCKTLQEVSTLHAHDASFDFVEYKRQGHIMSGAEIIVPRVIGFLEDEPIVQLLNEFA